jgi:hypothetical protein
VTDQAQKFRHPLAMAMAMLFKRASKALAGEPVPPVAEAAEEIAAAVRHERAEQEEEQRANG